MLATALGVDFDPNVSYDERKDVWKLSDRSCRRAISRSRRWRSRRAVDHRGHGGVFVNSPNDK